MSRRGRHGRHPHPHPAARPTRPAAAIERPAAPIETRAVEPRPLLESRPVERQAPEPRVSPAAVEHAMIAREPEFDTVPGTPVERPADPVFADAVPLPVPSPAASGHPGDVDGDPSRTTCTTAQLRRFIKSRPWVPMHELRRRFGIWGGDDDVTPIRVADHTLFIGLPVAEGWMVAELLVGGDVGYELSLDPVTPVIVGVYPMRPVPRG